MPKQLQTRNPVHIREFVADAAAQGAAHRDVIDKVRVQERGPDTLIEPYQKGIRLGNFVIPREAEDEIVARLFGEVRSLRSDRAAFQVVLQGFEDAVLSGDAARVITAWRRAFEVYDTLARDLASLAALPEQGRGAA